MKAISSFLMRSSCERWLLVEAAFFLCVFRLCLMLIPFRYVFRIGTKKVCGGKGDALPVTDRVTWAVRAVGNRIPGTKKCLIVALAARQMLLRRGFEAKLRIGVRSNVAEDFAAHAWIESGGRTLVGEFQKDSFVALPFFDV
ncbi:MAG: lasso peptide biosynthesis B2 protein [Desulfomonilaceae bacterium]